MNIVLASYDETVQSVVLADSVLVDGDSYDIPATDSNGNTLVGKPNGSFEYVLQNENANPGSFDYFVTNGTDDTVSGVAAVSVAESGQSQLVMVSNNQPGGVMKKNQAGQVVGAQMAALDGSVFSGAVTVYVTAAGSQAIGSVGGGVCTHRGNGYYTYSPSQTETNHDQIAFTFIGTGAAAVTVNVSTEELPANFAALSITAGGLVEAENGLSAAGIRAALGMAAANLDAQLDALAVVDAAIKAVTDNLPDSGQLTGLLTQLGQVLADTNELQTDLANGGRLDLLIDAIKAKTDQLGFTVAGQVDANARSINSAAVNGAGTNGNPWTGE